MARTIMIDPEEVNVPEQISERRLAVEVMNRAIEDARYADAYITLSNRKKSLSNTMTPKERDRYKRGFWNDPSVLAVDAMHFLMTSRCHNYLKMLDIDPEVFVKQLIQTQHTECVTPVDGFTDDGEEPPAGSRRTAKIATENKKRRMFRNNYKFYQERLRAVSGGRYAR